MDDANTIDSRRRRLAWRASRRGIKEMDLIVGGYADAHLAKMTEVELTLFEQLLEIPDQDLLSYATSQATIPADRDCEMLRAIVAFRPVILS
jgi:antitoxin CptB